MLTWLLSLIPGLFQTVNGITNAIANERIALLTAQTEQEKNTIQERIAALQANRDILIEESKHSSVDIWVRAALASGPVFILNKIFIYDKAFDGTTTMSPDLWNVVYIVLGFYCVHLFGSKLTK